eukprot:1727850-Heterocapsa_arctica.AAC.1
MPLRPSVWTRRAVDLAVAPPHTRHPVRVEFLPTGSATSQGGCTMDASPPGVLASRPRRPEHVYVVGL